MPPAPDAAAPVEHASIARHDAVHELREADGVGLLAKAERAAHDVEEHLDLGLAELQHPHVEDLVGNRRGRGPRQGHGISPNRSTGTERSPAVICLKHRHPASSVPPFYIFTLYSVICR